MKYQFRVRRAGFHDYVRKGFTSKVQAKVAMKIHLLQYPRRKRENMSVRERTVYTYTCDLCEDEIKGDQLFRGKGLEIRSNKQNYLLDIHLFLSVKIEGKNRVDLCVDCAKAQIKTLLDKMD